MKNKKTRRLTALLAALALLATALTGCSAADVGYMTLYYEIAKIKTFTFSGDTSIEISPDNGYFANEGLKINLAVSGAVSLKTEDLYLDLSVKYGVNEPKTPHEFNLTIADGMLYMPVQDCFEAYAFSSRFTDGYSDKMCGDIKAALEKELPGQEYVVVDISERLREISGVDAGLPELEADGKGDKTRDLFMNSLFKMFSDFDSGITKKTADGFSIEMTTASAMGLCDDLIKYIGTNKKTIFKETLGLLKGLEKIYKDDEGIVEIVQDAAAYMQDNEQGCYELVDSLIESYDDISATAKGYLVPMFEGSYVKNTLSKKGKIYSTSFDFLLIHLGEKLLSYKGKFDFTNEAVNKKAIDAKDPADFDDVMAAAEKADKKVNHAKEVVVSWDNGSSWTDMDITRVEGYDYEYPDRIIDNGTMYLPMRLICEWFGEDVTWDAAAKKAYIERGSQKIDMTGRIENSRTFVKIRDFEKLGYLVDYQYDSYQKVHTVTIKKN